MDIPSMCADVEKFMWDHELEEPILMGHSMGAKVAMGVALRAPETVSLMIAVDNAPVDISVGGSGFSAFGRYVNALSQIEQKGAELKSLKDCDQVLAQVEKNETIRQFLLTNMKRSPDGQGYKSRVPLDIIGKNLDVIGAFPFAGSGKRFHKPALFVRGKQSAYVADEYLNAIAEYYPKFDCVDIDAGHWLISEKPDEFVDVVTRWIDFKEDY
ncbi:unnamed protein product [Ambrosiozyma monospora]|uniref:Unnamed protein product n=1 Tax=Ambrosiozyma monospora TaxID=43982 RepID=A0A9W6YWT5_AMBMO|nr:unnamed protein product [Ambrosiozyma monospora]